MASWHKDVPKRKKKKPINRGPRTPRGTLSPSGTRGLGKKGSIGYHDPKQCDYMIGGRERLIRRTRKQPPYDVYNVVIVVGGKRCWNEATMYSSSPTNKKARCDKHLGATYDRE